MEQHHRHRNNLTSNNLTSNNTLPIKELQLPCQPCNLLYAVPPGALITNRIFRRSATQGGFASRRGAGKSKAPGA
jgi:hypothetical protein